MSEVDATVVCGTDLGESGEAAARLARGFAKRLGARLHLVHAIDLPEIDDATLAALDPGVLPAAEAMRRRLLERRQQAEAGLREFIASLAGDVEVTGSIAAGRPYEVLLRAAEERAAVAIVVGPHTGGSGLLAKVGERLLGTTARRVVRHADRQVLVASGERERTTTALAGDERLTLVVGVDFEVGGAAAIDAARRLDAGARLVLVHVLQDPFAPGDEPADWPALREQWAAQLRERLAAQASDVDAELRVEPGDPAQALGDVAAEVGAHLLVVGAHAGGALSRILLGSTAERCLRDSPVPVLVVPPAEPSTP